MSRCRSDFDYYAYIRSPEWRAKADPAKGAGVAVSALLWDWAIGGASPEHMSDWEMSCQATSRCCVASVAKDIMVSCQRLRLLQ